MEDTNLMVCLSISLYCLSVSQYLLDLSSYLILTGGSSLYLRISLSPNHFNKLSTFMVWVLDDEEGVWPWSVFWNEEVERGRRKGTGEIENQNLVCCILGFYELSG